jgi:hypothetical protein
MQALASTIEFVPLKTFPETVSIASPVGFREGEY